MPVFAVTTARDTGWDHARDIREQPFWDQHAAFADELVDRGVIILGGPIGGGDGEDLALLAVQAADGQRLTSRLPCRAEWELAAREDGGAGSLGGHARAWVPLHRRDGQRAEESVGAGAHGEHGPQVGRCQLLP
jgi:uncharacterized protein